MMTRPTTELFMHMKGFRLVLILFIATVTLNVLVAWGCILWSPYTTHTKPSDEPSDDGYPAKIAGPYGQPGWWFSRSGFGCSQAVLRGARGAEGWFVYWRGSHTPAYYRGGWPMHSLQSTVTFHDDRRRWNLPGTEIFRRGLQTNWLPDWLHAQQDRRLPVVPFWPGFVVNTLLYFAALTGFRLFAMRVAKRTTLTPLRA